MNPRRELFAVVTGDIVGFSGLSDEERREFHAAFNHSASRLRDLFADQLVDTPEIFRGDSWQFTIRSISESARIALFLRALVKGSFSGSRLDMRMSIGIGSVDFLPGGEITSGDGQAYRLSGAGLEAIIKPNRMTVEFPAELESTLTGALQLILKFIDNLAMEWTAAQSEAIAGALIGLTQERIAKEWVKPSVTQPAIAQHLDRAGWAAISEGLDFIEEVLREDVLNGLRTHSRNG